MRPAKNWARWSAQDCERLSEAWTRGGLHAAQALFPERSAASVRLKAENLDARCQRFWTSDEAEVLLRSYVAGGLDEAVVALPRRGRHAVSLKLRNLLTGAASGHKRNKMMLDVEPYKGLLALAQSRRVLSKRKAADPPRFIRNFWKLAERRQLISAWRKGGIEAACAALPQRTRGAIVSHARRLKLATPVDRASWDRIDEEMLKQLYPKYGPAETARRMSWRTPWALAKKAQGLGVVKSRQRKSSAGSGAALQ